MVNAHDLTENPYENWNKIKTFKSDKYNSKECATTLHIKDEQIKDPKKVGNTFNEHFNDVTLNIGKEGTLPHDKDIDGIPYRYDHHDSITYIQENSTNFEYFCGFNTKKYWFQ